MAPERLILVLPSLLASVVSGKAGFATRLGPWGALRPPPPKRPPRSPPTTPLAIAPATSPAVVGGSCILIGSESLKSFAPAPAAGLAPGAWSRAFLKICAVGEFGASFNRAPMWWEAAWGFLRCVPRSGWWKRVVG